MIRDAGNILHSLLDVGFNSKFHSCYPLKHHIIGKGELVIETAAFHNPIRATLRTFSPKEEVILKEPAKFNTALLQRDVKRITAQVRDIDASLITKYYDQVYKYIACGNFNIFKCIFQVI